MTQRTAKIIVGLATLIAITSFGYIDSPWNWVAWAVFLIVITFVSVSYYRNKKPDVVLPENTKSKFLFWSWFLPLVTTVLFILSVVAWRSYVSIVGAKYGLDHYLIDVYGDRGMEIYRSVTTIADYVYLAMFYSILGGFAMGIVSAMRSSGRYKKISVRLAIILLILIPVTYLVGCDYWGCHI